MYKPLLYLAIAVKEKINIREKNYKHFRGKMHLHESYVPCSSVNKIAVLC